MVMDAANGIIKKFHAMLDHAQHLVCTRNGLNGHHAPSVVFHLALMMSTINIVPITSSLGMQAAKQWTLS
jgi:hypothetical protein